MCSQRELTDNYRILPAGSSAAALPADMRCTCSQARPAGATDTFMCSASCSRWAKEQYPLARRSCSQTAALKSAAGHKQLAHYRVHRHNMLG